MIPIEDLKQKRVEGISYLRELDAKNSKPSRPQFGICGNFSRSVGEEIFILFPSYDLACKHWEHFSGSPSFPVPSPKKVKSNSRFHAAVAYDSSDKWSGAYGALRREFARYLADVFEKTYIVPALPADLVVDK